MNDLIDRQEAIEALKKQMSDWNDLYNIPVRRSIAILEQLPSAQPERKTGKWILSDAQNPEDVRNGNYAYTCSSCLHSDIHAKTVVVPFCWHCGANMRGEQDERQSK